MRLRLHFVGAAVPDHTAALCPLTAFQDQRDFVLRMLAAGDWFLQFHTKACIRFTPPIRRLLSAQYPGNRQIYPRGCERLRFWQCLKPFDASPRVCSRSSLECSPTRISFGFLIQRSPPRLLNAAAWIGLGPAPESRSRGARPHLSCSLSPRSVVHCKLPSMCIFS